jgi:hypothetical protein
MLVHYQANHKTEQLHENFAGRPTLQGKTAKIHIDPTLKTHGSLFSSSLPGQSIMITNIHRMHRITQYTKKELKKRD